MIEATCHCGAVQVRVPAAPAAVTDCNCSICRRLGTLWAYYPTADVAIDSAEGTATYAWGDRSLAFHRCKTCGCATHWQGLDAHADRVGVNARLFEPEVWSGLPVRRFDGAAEPIGGRT